MYFAGPEVAIMVAHQAAFLAPNGTPTTGGSTIGIGHEVSLKITPEYKQLRGMNSTFWQDVARCNVKVSGKIKFSQFDPTVGTWWLMNVIHPVGAPDGTTQDTSVVAFFGVSGIFSPADAGGVKLKTDVLNARFPEIPFSLQKNEWVALDLSFKASEVQFGNPV